MPYDIILGRDESDKKKFGDRGLVFLGKGYYILEIIILFYPFINFKLLKMYSLLQL